MSQSAREKERHELRHGDHWSFILISVRPPGQKWTLMEAHLSSMRLLSTAALVTAVGAKILCRSGSRLWACLEDQPGKNVWGWGRGEGGRVDKCYHFTRITWPTYRIIMDSFWFRGCCSLKWYGQMTVLLMYHLPYSAYVTSTASPIYPVIIYH